MYSFAFSGFPKWLSFVLLRKICMSSWLTAFSVLVILSWNWINFYSVLLCPMLSVWLEGCFWLMEDNMGIFVIELNRLVPVFLNISNFTPWFPWLLGWSIPWSNFLGKDEWKISFLNSCISAVTSQFTGSSSVEFFFESHYPSK